MVYQVVFTPCVALLSELRKRFSFRYLAKNEKLSRGPRSCFEDEFWPESVRSPLSWLIPAFFPFVFYMRTFLPYFLPAFLRPFFNSFLVGGDAATTAAVCTAVLRLLHYSRCVLCCVVVICRDHAAAQAVCLPMCFEAIHWYRSA